VDPLYLAESFYVIPEPAGAKAYSLLVQALAQSGRCAIAQLTKSNREHVVVIRPKGAGLIAHCLYYPSEVHSIPEFDALTDCAVKPEEAKLAAKLVENLAGDFDPRQYQNGYEARLSQLIASKLKGEVVAVPKAAPQGAPVVDMLEALKASLAKKKVKKAA
jgi:DNA end-binding protein Ku